VGAQRRKQNPRQGRIATLADNDSLVDTVFQDQLLHVPHQLVTPSADPEKRPQPFEKYRQSHNRTEQNGIHQGATLLKKFKHCTDIPFKG
jgi:hypothetical protein